LKRPNFLILMTDQHRGDSLGCAWPSWRKEKNPLRTPNLDALAAEGVRLANHFVQCPLCLPSRSTLLTGLSARAHSVRTNGINLPKDLPTVTGALAAAGYRTHSTGKIHVRIFEPPDGIDPETLDPADFPEAREMWERGRVNHLPSPYYGFQTTDYLGGHGPTWMWGDYPGWLKQRGADPAKILSADVLKPTASKSEQSFRWDIPCDLHPNEWIADRTVAFLEGAAKSDQPFMAWASFPDPHHPFGVPDPWYSMYDRAASPPPLRREGELDVLPPHFKQIYDGMDVPVSGRHGSTRMRDDQLREIWAITNGMISFIDDRIGHVLQNLKRLGLAENTVVVFLSDHGDTLGDHWMMNKGPFHFDSILNVPCLWNFPGRFKTGTVAQGLTSHLDFAPTILDMAGLPQPEYGILPGTKAVAHRQLRPLPGKSLRPLLEGKADRVQEAVSVENDEDYIGQRLRTVVTENHQLTMYVGEDGEMPWGELFDRKNDPAQLHNLWNDASSKALKNEMKAVLAAELVRTDNRMPRRINHA
jgi:arylsulfatase